MNKNILVIMTIFVNNQLKVSLILLATFERP